MRTNHVLCCALGVTLLSNGLVHPGVKAQVIPNGLGSAITTGNQGCQANCVITGGSQQQANLFHSFSEFSIPQGSTATLKHDAAVQTIFLRVTDAPSILDGQLATDVGGSLGSADLFFLNPHGVVFGPDASLQLGGSFLASTADRIQFSDGVEFVVREPQPLLSVNVPVGLQLAANAGAIEVGTTAAPGPGNALFLNENFSLNRSNRRDGLAVAQGQTLALISNGISMVGGNLTAPQGRIELGSVQPSQRIALNLQGQAWVLQYADSIRFSDVHLSQAASVDVSGDGSGSLQLRGHTVDLIEGAAIVSETLGNGVGGPIDLQAHNLNLLGLSIVAPPASRFVPAPSGIFVDVAPGQSGLGGDLNLQVDSLNVEGGAQITVATFGVGRGGAFNIEADTIALAGGTRSGPSSLSTFSLGDVGSGGPLTIQARELRLLEGSSIFANTFGDGDAGDLRIRAQTIRVMGANPNGASKIESVSSVPFTLGNGGDVDIQTQVLEIMNGAQVATATASLGNAGQLGIQATQTLTIEGRSPFIPPSGDEPGRSGLFSTAIISPGNAGDISVDSPTLVLQDGGIISVSNFPSFEGPPPGTGPSGTIRLKVREFVAGGDAGLDARTNFDGRGSGGANIEVNANSILLRDNSFINASAEGSADGGNVTLNTQFLVAPPQNDSDITARALSGRGGNINILAEGLLGLTVQPALEGNTSNDIDASSQAGVNGTVDATGLDAESKVAIAQIPDQPTDSSQLIGDACNGPSKLGGQFVVTGRGGLPPTPEEIRVDFAPLLDSTPDTVAHAEQGRSIHRPLLVQASPVQEAQRWKRLAKGEVVLVADGAIARVHTPAACL